MDTIQETVTTKMLAETNRSRVLQLIYNEKILTRRSICDALNLSAPTVGKIVDRLLKEGLVTEGDSLHSPSGRRPKTLSFVPTSHFSIGLQITRHKLRLVIIDLWGSTYTAKTYPLDFEKSSAYLKAVADTVNSFIAGSRLDREIFLGIGIAISGVCRANTLTVEYSSILNVHDWDISELKELLPYPITLISESYAAGFMEFRSSVRMNKMFYISISEGISGALLINNEFFTGFNNRAGFIGHMQIPAMGENGLECGDFETYCSTSVLTRAFDESLESFFSELKKDEPRRMAIWDTYLKNLAVGLGNIRSLMDIAIVIGGPLSKYIDDYLEQLLDLISEHNPFHDKHIYLRIGSYTDNITAAGAALQLVDRFLDL